MKVYINNHDYLTWPRAMADILAKQGHEPIFVDNASTYEPLLRYYDEECEYEVVRLGWNWGHTAPWRYIDAITLNREAYVVTDPDLDISGIPSDWEFALKEGLVRYLGAPKCGFSLDETRVPSKNPSWIEDGFYKYPDGNPRVWGRRLPGSMCHFFDYPVDTTFAMYRKGNGWSQASGIRTDRPYTARHLPWHIVLDVDPKEDTLQIPMDDEIYYYFTHANASSLTRKRMEPMLKEYVGRMVA